MIHLGTTTIERNKALKDSSYKSQKIHKLTAIFGNIDSVLHEKLAQLLTYYTIRHITEKQKDNRMKEIGERILRTFEELCNRQPIAYKIDEFLNTPRERIIESIKLIKQNELPGKFETWEKIMLWP